MSLKSQKFKYLDQLRSLGTLKIPDYMELKDSIPDIDFAGPYIMRSALQGEAQRENLLSGKSLSLANLFAENLAQALVQIQSQDKLEEVILQKQIKWDQHLTVICENQFFFVECKKLTGTSQFFYQSELGGTQSPLRDILNRQIKLLDDFFKQEKLWLMEWGFDGNELFLFQIQAISSHSIKGIFSSDLALQMIQSKERFQKSSSLFQLLHTEWKAYRYRKKKLRHTSFETKDVFLNWEFIFHYFRLFCLTKNLAPDEEALGAFYKNLTQDNFFSKQCKTHFALANQFRDQEQFPQFQFLGNQKRRFMGTGKKIYTRQEIFFAPELDPSDIYKLSEHKLILTKSLSLLGHGILAALEQGHFVVSGISEQDWEEIIKKDQIYLDFEREHLELK